MSKDKKIELEALAIDLMRKHRLIRPKGSFIEIEFRPNTYYNKPWVNWQFKWDKSLSTYGSCSLKKRTIYLSEPLTAVDHIDNITNTILHEIAHAITDEKYLMDDLPPHSKKWRKACLRIGGTGNRVGPESKLPPKFVSSCPNGHKYYANRRRFGASCGRCCPDFNQKYLIKWQRLEGSELATWKEVQS